MDNVVALSNFFNWQKIDKIFTAYYKILVKIEVKYESVDVGIKCLNQEFQIYRIKNCNLTDVRYSV